MSFHSTHGSSVVRPLRLLLASALTGLVATAAACSSDSTDDPAKGGTSASGSANGGTASSTAGKGANDAGKASGTGGTVAEGAGGEPASGGAPENGGGAAAGTTGNGGSSSGTAGSGGASAGSGGGGALPGNDVWNCVEAGGSCICQNNGDAQSANVCTGEYKCCFALPLGAATRCQCQDPGASKCSDLAGVFGPSGKVVDHCPP
jgi:hypothetical protein